MKNANVNYSNLSDYLSRFLGRKPSSDELNRFERNQNLILINRRSPINNAYHISFTNCTFLQLITDGVLLGGSVQLHSQEAGHRFYSVMFEEKDMVEEHYLMLDASVESVLLNKIRTILVQNVRLITIEELVMLYDPIMYNLN